ncbi:SLC13 family permease [Pollutibacter soli]|uniref:SLC13 family permease n=1 Tax=Pollutibacter soli TaxID=3034157 RepID=UPI003013EC42
MTEQITTNAAQPKKSRTLIFFIASLAISALLCWLLYVPEFTRSQTYVLFLLFFSVCLWITEAIPPFAVALFILAYLVFTLGNPFFNDAPVKIDQYVNTFSSSTIWLMLGGFFLARAMTKTRFDERLLRMTLKLSGNKPANILIAVMTVTTFSSMIMSNTAAAAMLVASLSPLLNNKNNSGLSKALLLSISIGTATGGMGTIIGTPSNVLTAGILELNNIHVDFLEWMKYGVPVTLLLSGICCFVLLRLYVKNKTPINTVFESNAESSAFSASKKDRVVVLVVLISTLVLWLTSSVHHISVSAVSAVPIVAFTLTGIITADDVKSMPWDVLLLIAGGMSLGLALESTGILAHYALQMQSLTINPFALILIFAIASMLISNVMSNAATSAILLPMAFALLPGFEKESAIAVALASSAAIFLPVSTPPNAIVYSTGLLSIKDFRLGGLLIGILGPVLAAIWVMIVRNWM